MSKRILVDSGDFCRVQANDVEQMGEGGRVVLVGDPTMLPERLFEQEKITNVTTVLNFRKDEPMRVFPSLALSSEERRYRVLVLQGVTDEDMAAIAALLEERGADAA